MTKVFEATHRKKNGEFVNTRAETFYTEVESRIQNRLSQFPPQMSPGGSSVQSTTALSTTEMDQIYEEVAPKKKGRVLGYGSIHDTPAASSSRPPEYEDPVVLRNQLEDAQTKINTLERRQTRYDSILDVIAASIPGLADKLREHEMEDRQEQEREQQRQQQQGRPSSSTYTDPLQETRRIVEETPDADLLRDLMH